MAACQQAKGQQRNNAGRYPFYAHALHVSVATGSPEGTSGPCILLARCSGLHCIGCRHAPQYAPRWRRSIFGACLSAVAIIVLSGSPRGLQHPEQCIFRYLAQQLSNISSAETSQEGYHSALLRCYYAEGGRTFLWLVLQY